MATSVWWLATWISLYALVVTAAIYLSLSHWAYDDPFITYRYAYNLAHGSGFVYNAGERVLSTTTPLFTLFLAGFSFLWPDLPRLANLAGAISLAAGALFLWDLARSWQTPLAGWAGLLLYPSFPLLLTTLGSETPLYLAFCLGAFAFFARQNYPLASLMSALAILTRPDGALVPLLIAIAYLVQGKRTIPWRAVIMILVLTLPWFAFAWWYFGSPLPATLAAKQQQGAMAISQRFFPGFLDLAEGYLRLWHYRLATAFALLGVVSILLKERKWALILAWTLLYFLSYSALGISHYFWYYAPLVPGFIVLSGLGISLLVRGIHAMIRGPSIIGKANLQVGSPLFALVGLLLISPLFYNQVKDGLRLRQQTDSRYQVYRAMGEWLQANSPPDAKVGALEIGIIGYYSHRLMIDFAGLLRPEVAARLTENSTYADAATWAIYHYQPEYLIIQDGGLSPPQQDYIEENCHQAQRFPGKSYRHKADLSIYACPQ